MNSAKEFFGKVSVFSSIVFGAIFFTIHAKFLYQIIVKIEKLDETVGLSASKIFKNYDILMQYMNRPFQKNLNFPDFASSAQGLKHFSEVKTLFLLATFLFLLSLIPTIFTLRAIHKDRAFWKFLVPIKMFSIVTLCLTLFSFFGFDEFFVMFHQIVFRNNDWLYDPLKDPVINILPENYFMLCFFFFFFLVFIGIGVLYLLGKRDLKNLRRF